MDVSVTRDSVVHGHETLRATAERLGFEKLARMIAIEVVIAAFGLWP